MSNPGSTKLPQLLQALQNGAPSAFDELMILLFEELRVLARRISSSGSVKGQSGVNATHQARLLSTQLMDETRLSGPDRIFLYRIAGSALRRIIIDECWNIDRLNQSDDGVGRGIDDSFEFHPTQDLDLSKLDTALNRLEILDAHKAKVAELRLFTGLTHQEIAQVFDTTLEQTERDWTVAKAWLVKELKGRRR